MTVLLLLVIAALGSPAEEELRELVFDGQLVTARRKAEELLAEHPDSIEGHWAMGRVWWQLEGEHARAMYHYEKARSLYEDLPEGGEHWLAHAHTLSDMADVAGEMDDRELELELMDAHDALYDPNFVSQRAWAHMKLGQTDQAMHWVERGKEHDKSWQVSLALNAECALRSEAGERQASLAACRESLEFSRGPGLAVDIDASNAAQTAVSNLRFDLAEEWAREGTRGRASPVPWFTLTDLLLDQGRGEEAVKTLKGMQRMLAAEEPQYRVQYRARADAQVARLLLVAGLPDKGLELMDRAMTFPDRQGTSSGAEEQALGGNAVMRLALRRSLRQRQAEQAAGLGPAGRVWHALGSLLPQPRDWSDRSTARSVLTNPRYLARTWQIYMDGGLYGVPTWLLGDLVPVVGPGVAATALKRAMELEARQGVQGIEAYYTALEGEIELARGRRRAALELLEASLDALPPQEVLLRARVAALAGHTAWKLDDRPHALELLELAMTLDPGTIRRQELSLPAEVSVRASGGVARHVGRILRRSPRLKKARGAFRVDVGGAGDALEVCLFSPTGSRLSCAETARPRPAEDEEPMSDGDYARLVAEGFHERAFAMPLGLSTLDLRSLDGTTGVDSEAARERLESVLEGI